MAQQLLIPLVETKWEVPPPRLLIPTEDSWFKAFAQNLKDALFPEKLPPLRLTSRPVKVRDIWGDSGNRKRAAMSSLIVHGVMLGTVIVLSILGVKVATEKPREHVTLIAPPIEDYQPQLPITPKSTQTMGGGGGGGDRDKLQAPKGRLPKQAMEQFTPPAVVIRNDNPKLAMEPSIIAPPNVKLPTNNMPNIGNPLAKLPGPPSNGTGSGGGIGSGSGGGIGSGSGPGLGPGSGGGYGGGVFKVGGGVTAPRGIFTPDPEYSEEARKAKYQGTVVLWLIVDQSGKPRQIKVSRGLGMGLDQKAMEAVQQWKFDPAKKDGVPVAVQINVEVNFHLY